MAYDLGSVVVYYWKVSSPFVVNQSDSGLDTLGELLLHLLKGATTYPSQTGEIELETRESNKVYICCTSYRVLTTGRMFNSLYTGDFVAPS